MLGLTLALRFSAHLIAALAMILGVGSAARAAIIVINDGMSHVIDDDTYASDSVYAQNVGCNVTVQDPCVSPGAPTAIAFVPGGAVSGLAASESSSVTMSGGTVEYDLFAFGTSTVTMSGGTVWDDVTAYDFSTIIMSGGVVNDTVNPRDLAHITMTGGTVLTWLYSEGSSTLTMSGGWVAEGLRALDSSTITIVGYDFAVNGVPVPYGDLTDPVGRLTGTLASGETIDNIFYQGDGDYTGTIRLVPEPSTGLLLGLGLAGLALFHRRVR